MAHSQQDNASSPTFEISVYRRGVTLSTRPSQVFVNVKAQEIPYPFWPLQKKGIDESASMLCAYASKREGMIKLNIMILWSKIEPRWEILKPARIAITLAHASAVMFIFTIDERVN